MNVNSIFCRIDFDFIYDFNLDTPNDVICAGRRRAPICEKFHKQVFCRKLVKNFTMSKFPEIGVCEKLHNVCEKFHNESL